jgi:hypothetical protein
MLVFSLSIISVSSVYVIYNIIDFEEGHKS